MFVWNQPSWSVTPKGHREYEEGTTYLTKVLSQTKQSLTALRLKLFCFASSHAMEKEAMNRQDNSMKLLQIHTCYQWSLWHTDTVQFQGHICPCCGRRTPRYSSVRTVPPGIAPCKLHPADQQGENSEDAQTEMRPRQSTIDTVTRSACSLVGSQ